MNERPGNDWRTLRSLFPYIWGYRRRVLLALAFLVLAKVAMVSVPWFLKQIVDALDGDAVLTLPLGLVLAYGGVRIASVLFGELRDALFAKVTQGAIRRIALKVFRHLHTLSLRFHLDRQMGGVSRDIERGSRGIAFLLNFMVFNIVPTLVEIGLIAIVLFAHYDVWFALVPLLTACVYIAFTLTVTEWRMRFRREMNRLDSEANTKAIDSLLNYETVKYFTNEDYEARRYDADLARWEKAAIRNQTSLAALNIGQGTIIAAGMTVLMLMAGQGVVDGAMSIGDLVMVNAYLLQMFIPMNFLGFVYREIKHSLADMERMFGLLDEQAEIPDRPDARPLVVRDGEIRFAHVDFAYEPSRPILRDVDLTIPAGRRLAVVGSSGSGKSTLVRLLFRFYDVDAGAILIDGQDIRDVTQKSLRAAIAIVPQDTVLFNDTIHYNIAYARPEASRVEVEEAARMAHLDDFIAALPKGFDTVVGERGLKVSGGEKQRIAIARAILKRPRILVFDEATSALDSAAEQAILKAMREVAADHTTLVIAHRLSTIVDADEIVVLDAGRIVERGRHAELLRAGGRYAEMWRLQQEEERERPAERP